MIGNIKGKRLLVLGGVLGMAELVQRAKDLGVEVYVTDYLGNSPAKKYADKSFMVSTTDVDAVAQLCKDESIDGIITGNVDMLLPYYARICEKANLPCYGTLEHFILMTDKKKFKDICRKYDVLTIPEYNSSDCLDDVTYPVLVKPIDSSGSRGISVCGNKDELEAGIEKALSYSPSKTYMIERYMTGDEVVLYYYFQNGNPVFMGMCDRYVNKEQYGVAPVSSAYVFPSRYTKKHLDHTDEKIKNMYRKIHIQNGCTFLQAFAEDGLPYLYEPGYRLNGAREQYIYGNVNNVSLTDMMINFALTGKMAEEDIEQKCDPFLNGKCACMLSPAIKIGEIAEVKGVDEMEMLDAVKKIIKINDVGNKITDKNLGTLNQIAYRAYIVEDNMEKLKEVVDTVLANVVYYDKKGESMMLTPFDSNLLISNY